MNCTVIAVGKLREKPFRAMADEYLKRLSRYGKIREVELPDLPEPAGGSAALEEQVREKEGAAILRAIRPGDYVIALTIPGRQWDSPAFARHLRGPAISFPRRVLTSVFSRPLLRLPLSVQLPAINLPRRVLAIVQRERGGVGVGEADGLGLDAGAAVRDGPDLQRLSGLGHRP